MTTTSLLLEQFTSALRNLMTPPENEGFTPLALAAREGCVEIMQELMTYDTVSFARSGSHSNACNHRRTPLEVAIKLNQWEVIRALANLGVDMNTFQPGQISSHGDYGGSQSDCLPVSLAIQEGHVESLKILIECGANVKVHNNTGVSPLHIAAREGQVDAIRVLVDAGVNVNVISGVLKHSPMHYAAAANQADAIRTLAELGGNVSALNSYHRTPLETAVVKGHVVALTTLVELNTDNNFKSINGDTPMHWAVNEGNVEVIKALARLNTNVNQWNNNGDVPLHIAVIGNKVNAIRALLAVGADVNVGRKNGWSALHIAVEFSCKEVIRALIEGRADIDDSGDCCSLSPLDIALDIDREMASTLLVQCGADVTTCAEEYTHGAASVHPDKQDNFVHVYDMMDLFFQNSDIPNLPVNNGLFSLAKLMIYSTGYNTCNYNSSSNPPGYIPALEAAIGSALHSYSALWQVTPQELTPTDYTVKARLTRIAWRVCCDSMLIDGDRISISTKAHRYVELVCCLFNTPMLRQLISLRITCKSCNERRRFPACGEVYRELEANLIESFFGYDACRFISTGIMCAVLRSNKCK